MRWLAGGALRALDATARNQRRLLRICVPPIQPLLPSLLLSPASTSFLSPPPPARLNVCLVPSPFLIAPPTTALTSFLSSTSICAVLMHGA